jgi:rare lipoprotein A
MDNTNEILAQKKAWRQNEQRREDRRKKDGTAADRRGMAEALNFSRHVGRTTPISWCHCMNCEHLRVKAWPWYKQVWKSIFPVILVVLMAGSAQAYTASWYGVTGDHCDPWKHVRTASGELFNENALTAASWKWPLGSYIRVTNLATMASVVVKITDRGPARHLYRKGRIVDLTRGAFARIADLRDGVIKVEVKKL